MPNIDPLKEIQVEAVVALVFLIISLVAAKLAYPRLPDSKSKTTFMATMAGIWGAIALFVLVAIALYPLYVDSRPAPEAASRDHIADNTNTVTIHDTEGRNQP